MTATCQHCHTPGPVLRVRVAEVGLRWFCQDSIDRLDAMGLVVIVVPTEPRQSDRGRSARRHPGFGTRHIAAGLRWLMAS